jgi:hypothetical protein
MLIVDPQLVLTKDAVAKLAAWARSGRMVILPRSPLFTESGRAELEKALAAGKSMEIHLGLSYRLHSFGASAADPATRGSLLLFDLPDGDAAANAESWRTFLGSVLSLAEIQSHCSVSDGRLGVIPMEKRDGRLGLFIMNGTSRPVAADLMFPQEVCVSDLTASFTPNAAAQAAKMVPANRFALEVPPSGILPIAISDGGVTERGERPGVAATSGATPAPEAQWN